MRSSSVRIKVMLQFVCNSNQTHLHQGNYADLYRAIGMMVYMSHVLKHVVLVHARIVYKVQLADIARQIPSTTTAKELERSRSS